MATQSFSTSTGVGSSNAPTVVEVLVTKRNPKIWVNYDKVLLSNGSTKAFCKCCKSHSTKYCDGGKSNPESGQTTMSRDGGIFTYQAKGCREAFVGFVIQEALPFNHFDNPRLTKVIQDTLQPRYNHGLSFSDLMYVTKKMALKELMEALRFICTVSFWRMVFLWTFPLIISYIKLLNQSIFSKKPIYNHCAVLPSPPITSVSTSYKTSNRLLPICIITGATSGLGAAAALALSKEGFFLVLTGRSSDKLSKVMSDIRKQNKEAHLEAFQVDLSSFSSIMRFKESLENWLLDSDMHPSVQLLINNAGILATTSRLTSEGHDRMMGTNYIGAFSLTELLLPLLNKSSVPSRIVNLTSFTHRNVSSFRPEKEIISGKCFSELKHYPCAQIYEYSKLCILLFSYELHRQLHLTEGSKSISVMAVDPGAVRTNIMGEVPFYISQVAFFTLRFVGLLQSPEAGISSILDAALAPPGMSGLYFFGGNGRTVDSSTLSYNIKLSRELWDTSRDIFNDSLLMYNRISVSSEKVD